MHQRRKPDGRYLSRDLCDSQWPADLVGRFTSDKDAADIGQRTIDHEPGFLDPKPKRGRRIDALGGDVASRGLAGDAKDAKPMRVAESVLHLFQFRRAVQLLNRVAALDRERQLLACVNAD